VPGRWYLGGVKLKDGAEPNLLSSRALGRLVDRPEVELSTPGRPLDFAKQRLEFRSPQKGWNARSRRSLLEGEPSDANMFRLAGRSWVRGLELNEFFNDGPLEWPSKSCNSC
jgi:hypothetical protein